MKFPLLPAAFALLFASPVLAGEANISGYATAVDGDTLDFSGTTVRLYGIDAPETGQDCTRDGASWNCGIEAKELLAELVAGQRIECQSYGDDDAGNLVAVCVRDGLDLGLTMIEAGLAVSLDKTSDSYSAAEALRKTHKFGLWAAEFEDPAMWRAAHMPAPKPAAVTRIARQVQPATSEQVYRNKLGCAIKGNRSRRGDWIYHLPGMNYYEQTRPEELFCTESQALRAGYRRSKE
ncbi:MAG: thermonuclease family protein [Pontixanthobacter sp.]